MTFQKSQILPALSLSLWFVAGAVLNADGAESSATSFSRQTSFFARLDTNKIHYVSLGAGPQTVVLVHGWSGSTHVWHDQVPALQNKVRLILIDLPGHGKSDKPRTAYTMEFFARAIDAVFTDAKIEKAVLAGFSMGAPALCRFYRQFPNKVQALVTVDGSLRGFTLTPEKFEEWIAPYRMATYQEAATKFIGAMFPNPGTEHLRERVLEDVRNTPQHVMSSAFEGLFDKAAWEPKKIEVPLLVINAKSPFWTEDYQSFVRTLQPRAEYHVLEGTGHFLMLEKPAEFNSILLAFLDKHRFIASASGKRPATHSAAQNTLTDVERAAGWKLLFDGKSLLGWHGYPKKNAPQAGWKVEEGILKKVARERGGDIVTDETFEDFVLSWEWRMASGGNNGLKYFVTDDRPSAPGHEYQLVDDQRHPDAARGPKRTTAAFYDVLPPAPDKPLKPVGEWNTSRVVVQGNHIEHWLNGGKVLEYELGSDVLKTGIAASKFKDAPGFGAKIKGRIMLTDHGDEGWFRNLKIRELPEK